MTDNGRNPRLDLAMWCVIAIAGILVVGASMAASAELGIAPVSLVLAMALIPVVAWTAIGLVVRSGDLTTFQMTDRTLPALWNGMGGAAGAVPATFLFGLAGLLYVLGFDGLAYVLGLSAGMAVAAIAIGPRLTLSGARTVPDYFGLRFGTGPRIVAAFIVAIVSFALLVAECSIATSVLSRLVDAGRWTVVLSLAAIVLLCTMAGGMQAVARMQVPQYVVLAAGYLAVLGYFAAAKHGVALPQLSYGDAISEITRLETDMIEKGLADLRIFQPHTKAFLQIDRLNFFALTLTVMAGTASLPHIAGRFLTAPTSREARLTGAWTALFLLLLLLTAPAYAAYAKLEVYSLIAGQTPFASLPPWIESLSRADLVHIHGTSLKMLEDVVGAVRSGAADVSAVATYLKAHGADQATAWLDLKPQSKTAMLDAAKLLRDAAPAAQWDTYQSAVLPAAALAAGNKTGFLTHGGFVIEPAAVMVAVAGMAGAPLALFGLLGAAFASAIVATTSGLAMTIANALGHDFRAETTARSPPSTRLWLLRAALLFTAGLTAIAAVATPPDAMAAIMFALSLAAASLFPALMLAIWWRRTTAWGVLAGMVVGCAVAAYYMIGTRYMPVGFYEMWPEFSNASDVAIRKFASLKTAWTGAPEGDARAAAWVALEAHARGAGVKVGLANWFGVHGSAVALFALPASLFTTVVVSLVTPRPSSSTHA